MFGTCGGMAQSNANLEVEEICTEANSPDVMNAMRWHPQDDKTSAQTAATSGAAKAGGPWEFLLARYEELRGVHSVIRELLKGRGR